MVSQTIGTNKVKLTEIWGINLFYVVDMMPPGALQHRLLPCPYYGLFAGENFPEGKQTHADRLNVHLDSCRIHSLNGSKWF
jgi:hypothetical protein